MKPGQIFSAEPTSVVQILDSQTGSQTNRTSILPRFHPWIPAAGLESTPVRIILQIILQTCALKWFYFSQTKNRQKNTLAYITYSYNRTFKLLITTQRSFSPSVSEYFWPLETFDLWHPTKFCFQSSPIGPIHTSRMFSICFHPFQKSVKRKKYILISKKKVIL